MKSAIIICMLSLLLTGCSSSYRLEDYPSKENYYNKVNTDIAGKKVKIITNRDSIIVTEDNVSIKNDSVSIFSLKQSILYNNISLTNVKKINIVNHSQGAVNGLGVGFVTGAVAGYAIMYANKKHSGDDNNISKAITGALIGAAAGVIIGIAVGSQENYYFEN